MTTSELWRPTQGLRTALVWLFASDIAASTVMAGVTIHRSAVVDRYHRGAATFADAQSADDLLGTVALVVLLLFLATGIVFIVWQWRGAKNNELLGHIRPRFGPGWSIGGWFVPFANLVIPVRIMHDLWQGSDPATRNYRDWRGLPRWSVIGWWWGLYLAGSLFSASPIGAAARIASAALAIVVVRQITDRQETARALLTTTTRSGSNPAAGPGWYPDPKARFDHRYWDGTTWTNHVSKAGEMATDPVAEIGGAG